MAQSLQGGDPEWLVEAGEVQELLEGVEAPELLRSGVHNPHTPNGWALEEGPYGKEKTYVSRRDTAEGSAQVPSAQRNGSPHLREVERIVAAQGLSPNGDGSDY